MATKLIELEEGLLVEVEAAGDGLRRISGGADEAEKVSGAFEKIRPLLMKVVKPLGETWKEMSQDVHLEQAEVQLGVSFEGEGNLFIAKSKANASLTVKLVLKPAGDKETP